MAQPAPAVPTQEEISSFSADITVREDGMIDVQERIDYYFPTQRHGIFRDIPVRYEAEGKEFTIPIDVIGVTDASGRAWRYDVSENRYAVRIKIGDPDVYVQGAQTYVIRYTASSALRYFEDHDELYWNVTGNEWQVPIRRSSATVRLPAAVPGDEIAIRCFTGPQGSTRQDCIGNVQGTAAYFAANDMLTAVVGWPPGLVAKIEPRTPGILESALPFTPFLIPVLVIGLLLMQWWTKGRDPEGRGTIVAQYDPPDKLTPAEMGVIYDEEAGLKDLSSTIVDLAVRGYLKIRETKKDGVFLSSKDHELDLLKDFDTDPTLKPFERAVLDALFVGAGRTVRLSEIKEHHTFYAHLPRIKEKLYEGLVLDGYFPKNPEKVRGAYYGIGGAILVIVFFFFPGVGALGESMLFVSLFVSMLVTAAAIMVFAKFMPRRTAKGVAALEHAYGFHEYLDKAEKYRIQWQEKENIFERFLPYAMVFGVAEHWAGAFKDMAVAPPNWYEGSAFHAGAFDVRAFSSALGSMSSSISTAMASSPQKSSGGSGFGGGGGGFSGGGGGGGGGGSW